MTHAASIAVIDPAIPVIVSAVFGAVVAIVTPILAFKTAALNKRLEAHDVKIAEVIKTSDGMRDALVKVTERAGLAEGELAGAAIAENKANAAAVAKATGAADAASQAHKE